MKVLAIRGRNLTSLAGEFEVDLHSGALRGAGVFAITGPVGSGKSTLLDALCLALYNRTPRFSHQGGVPIGRADEDEKLRLRSNDVRSVLRRGTSEGHAEVDFVGTNDVVYRARWSVRRARNRINGAVQGQDVTLKERDTGLSVGGTNTEVLAAIQDRVGLSFDQFCRSALLAQGDFARFLRSEDRDRAELLERMTGTELYGELSMAAFAKRKESQIELGSMRERLADLHVLPDDERAAKIAERDELQKELQKLEAGLKAAERAQRWHADGKRLVRAAEKAAAEVEELEAETAKARGAAEEEKRGFIAALTHVAQEFTVRRGRRQVELDEVSAWCEEHRHDEALCAQWDRWSSVLSRYRGSAEETRSLAVARAEAEKREGLVQEAVQEAVRLRDAAEVARDAAEAAHRTGIDGGASLDETLTSAEKELERLRAVESLFERVAAVEKNRERCEAKIARARAAAADASSCVSKWSREFEIRTVRRQEAERALRRAEKIRSLEQHRHELVAGEPCPLCGALEHPTTESTDAVIESDLEARLGTLVAEELEARTALQDAERERATQQALHDEAKEELDGFVAELGTLRADVPERYASLEVLLTEKAAWTERRDAILRARKRVEELRREAARCHLFWMDARDEVLVRERQLTEVQAEIARIDTSLRHQEDLRARAVAELEGAFSEAVQVGWKEDLPRDPDGFLSACQRRVLAFERHVERRKSLAEDHGRLLAVCEALRGLSAEQSDARFDAALTAVRVLGDEDQAAELLQREIRRREVTRRAAEELVDRTKAARTILAERRRARADHEKQDRPLFDEAAAVTRAGHARDGLARIQPRRDELFYEIRRDDEVRVEVARLTPEIERREASVRVWDELSELIGSFDGRSFRIYAQSLTLDCLLGSANRHLQDLAPRYRLQRVPGHDLSLQVVDLDMGDDVRSVNSLSGGESFLVSLALALGLSSISAATTRVESLFIDEGFGSLDVQTLDSALATLDALQATGRQVGVISHVAGIAERIGARVEVVPVGSGRSSVRVAQVG